MPRSVVRTKPEGSLETPGWIHLAMSPAKKPMMIVQMIPIMLSSHFEGGPVATDLPEVILFRSVPTGTYRSLQRLPTLVQSSQGRRNESFAPFLFSLASDGCRIDPEAEFAGIVQVPMDCTKFVGFR